MNKINVIDLDNTLLPYDSFRKYTFLFLFNHQCILYILPLIILRKLKIIDSSVFKKRVIQSARKTSHYNKTMEKFADHLFSNIDNSVIDILNEHTDLNTLCILCTASPEDYVKHLSRLLKWKHIASQLDSENNYFIHMYGPKKIKTINKLYPSNLYKYNFTISDSKSDNELLMAFENSLMYSRS